MTTDRSSWGLTVSPNNCSVQCFRFLRVHRVGKTHTNRPLHKRNFVSPTVCNGPLISETYHECKLIQGRPGHIGKSQHRPSTVRSVYGCLRAVYRDNSSLISGTHRDCHTGFWRKGSASNGPLISYPTTIAQRLKWSAHIGLSRTFGHLRTLPLIRSPIHLGNNLSDACRFYATPCSVADSLLLVPRPIAIS